MSPEIDVVAAVVQRGKQVLLCQRHHGHHLPLYWEFPGGKIEAGESPEQGLIRELSEEIGVHASVGMMLADIRHTYPEKYVRIRFYRVTITGEPLALVHRQLRWVTCDQLDRFLLPPPNSAVVDMLCG